MSKRIYIAGGSDERLTVVRPLMQQVRDLGFIVTHDWTQSPGYDRQLSTQEAIEQAKADLAGIHRADIVWIVAPEEKSEGASFEAGYTLRSGMTLIVSGSLAERNIFFLLADHCFLQHEDALRWLREIGS